jgi:diguanylate cyclase (GGDEF)-like protein
MSESYNNKNKIAFTRESIIGLGEDSFRKNYYPQLQEKIIYMEQLNARNQALLSSIPDILLVFNTEGNIVTFSLFDQKDLPLKEELLSNAESMDILVKGATEAYSTEGNVTKEFQLTTGQTTYYLEARFRRSGQNEVLIIVRDMTERILLELKLRELVERDYLTKLYNRGKFEFFLHKYMGEGVDNLAIISIDVNGLKFINDTLGHLAGDETIINAAKIITVVFEDYGHIARIGGDEFGIILESISEKQLERLFINLNQQVELYNAKERNCDLSLAYGYSHHLNGVANTEFMFREADNKMYQNKLLKKESIRSTFVKTFMKALEAKDFISEGHVIRMENYAILIAKALSLRQDQMDSIILLTKFHDIGKIGIPDRILKKPGSLNDDEWKVMRTHSAIGERIALEAAEIKDIAHLILKHHEKWDGTGYPLGLSGEDIPLECRVLAIVDTFDAMTNDRPYRKAIPVAETVKEIIRCKGTQFDPYLVDVFLQILKETGISL